jgi:hypothetical protein
VSGYRLAPMSEEAEQRIAEVEAWLARRGSHRAQDFPLARVLEHKRTSGASVSVVLPAREVAETLGP